ncbi:glycosyl transferase [Dyella acidiphila]|uniref:Glycosyl transferase n=1 Tax=Dyella acidiphila TaxID=2775866 RepID=A0ABR9GE21_9GAMM|nr:glycosyl transferase [Dyella acidiphila]MBE1162284.1 glycosyl transferase [Dyella acidiphila]
MKRINLFVFATHHLSNNVAAQRFKGLLKYLDPAKYRVFIFTREPAAAAHAADLPPGLDVTVFPLAGHCVGSESSVSSSLLMLAAAFIRPLPLLLARFDAPSRPWFISALKEADRLCREKLAMGERCVAIGTYSPIDALIAAATLAHRYGIVCLQDFRDGLVFEPLGKPGWLRTAIRKLVERRVVEVSDLITSVSGPLVDDFRRRYPDKTSKVLPNGYDPSDFAGLVNDADSEKQAAAIMARYVPAGATLIGHFGRIGASDASASTSLDCFIDAMNNTVAGMANVHVMFVGALTPSERASMERAKFSISVLEPVERRLALQLMKQCDKLLLLTGSRASCATGKIFEYLAAGADILCISAVRNAATEILAETGAGQTLLTRDLAGDAGALRKLLAPPAERASRNIKAYSKVEQAGMLDNWISQMVLT